MKSPHKYLDEIKENLEKLRAQKTVTPAENALFGMIDGLAGLQITTMERVARLEALLAGREEAAMMTEARLRERARKDTRPERTEKEVVVVKPKGEAGK